MTNQTMSFKHLKPRSDEASLGFCGPSPFAEPIVRKTTKKPIIKQTEHSVPSKPIKQTIVVGKDIEPVLISSETPISEKS